MRFFETVRKGILPLAIGVFLISCNEFPYTPEKEPLPGVSIDTTTESTTDFKVFTIVPTFQICNPSISLDTVNYKGCMLWLNFHGELNHTVPEALKADYAPVQTLQHDRMIISDTSNTVRWVIKKEVIGIEGEIQDPEWSTHPDYIACLGGNGSGMIWDGYAVRISDKKSLKFNNGKMNAVSTPHLWVSKDVVTPGAEPTSPSYDLETGMIDKESVNTFFGTYNVKIVFSLKKSGRGLVLYYIDYSEDMPALHELAKPAEKEKWTLESALISPDGHWITYNAFESINYYEVYVQKLSSGTKPFLIAAPGADPHWWVHPDDPDLVTIVYAVVNGANLVQGKLSNPKIQISGDLGFTYMQIVKLYPNRNGPTSFMKCGDPVLLFNLPFKGGRSPEGSYFCTGYEFAYIGRWN